MIATYLNTVRYLRPAQVYNRIRRRRPRLTGALEAAPRQRRRELVCPIARPAAQTGPNRFRFLNQERAIRTWNDAGIPKLWLYNLHYFEHPAENLIERWILGNPIGTGNGWEPYPTAIRIVNWVKWALRRQQVSAEFLRSLAEQAEYLSQSLEYHLGANHLFADLVALTCAGMFFQGELARRWWETGSKLLRAQIAEQILADGAHYERSPMYHALVLESLLDLLNVSQVYGLAIADRVLWSSTASSMLSWLAKMTHPDGCIAFFNDAAFGIAPEPGQLFDYAERLGVQPGATSELHASGYARLENDRAMVIFDAAPIGPDHQPGHAHADTLSFELSARGKRMLVNSGTSTYERGPERQWQRGTAAHNTVRIDGEDQSEVWSAFRVARRARSFDLRTNGKTFAEAAHDGYRRLSSPVIHRRRVDLGTDRLRITDSIEGIGRHRIEVFFHFHPDAQPQISLDPKLEGSMAPSHWYPEFNQAVGNTTLTGTWAGSCPVTFVTTVFLP
ncbi:MAG TPA: alginate lyase family protein [Bryobacteraceae bacterium]|nr:alginate lyase family protein [Bryobacteraceae bacterium]